MTRNYFRVGEEYARGGNRLPTAVYFFFDDEDEIATAVAFGAATRAASALAPGHRHERICMYRPPRHEGPWDDTQVIGHRPLRSMQADTQNDDVIHERRSLQDLFVNRRSLPKVI